MKATARWRSSIARSLGHASQESMRSNTSPQHAHAMKCAGSAPTLHLAFAKFAEATLDRPPVEANGSKTTLLTRVEVVVEADMEPAYWLAHQSVYPRVYFSNQNKSLRAAGVGAAQRIGGTGVDSDEALAAAFGSLAGAHPRTRFYGGMRFDSQAKQLQEWDSFGGSVFILPLWELQVCDGGKTFLACHIRWSPDGSPSDGEESTAPSWDRAVRNALLVMQRLHWSAEVVSSVQQTLPSLVSHAGSLDASDWEKAVRTVLQGIDDGQWSKVVLAQRVSLHFSAVLEPMHLLQRLLEADDAAIAPDAGDAPSHVSSARRHAYLFLLQLDAEVAFMGCTPEKLFKLDCGELSTEALAGTRPRGDTAESDAALAHELLHCEKDLREVMAISDFLVRALSPSSTQLNHSEPFVLQLRHVQHICIPFSAKLAPTEDMHQPVRSALELLHPTPAVCGTPSGAARRTIRELERFDRGFYAGPLGYLASDSCEFCVGIRSALLRGAQASIFAGAGIVRGSTATSEWEEVHVKMKNFVSLVLLDSNPRRLRQPSLYYKACRNAGSPNGACHPFRCVWQFPCASDLMPSAPSPFLQLPNLNALYASMLFEELLRSGLGHVVLSPGSRCAPLTVAVARSGCAHSLANDERGAGFMALGFARASGRCAAVVVSSGTAVANLLPAVVEASQDRVPILLITADRPPELRDTAANQTVNQVGMLSSSGLRWFKDMPCPSTEMPLEPLLADASYALNCATGSPCGPVHLNVMLREPLAPSEQPWPRELLTKSARVSRWLYSRQPFTTHLRAYQGLTLQPDAQLLPLIAMLRTARRGLIVAGALFTSAQQRATSALASRLGWPVLPDVCSGMRGSVLRGSSAPLAPLYDVLLSDAELSAAFAVDVVLQVGGRLVSKRLQAAVASSSTHIMVEEHGERMDPSHCVTHRLQGDIASILGSLQYGLADEPIPLNPLLGLCAASREADAAVQRALSERSEISEAWVAHHICSVLTSAGAEDDLLFVSNSMPIRYVDMFCASTPLVLSNRGASGIDGILHTAIGATLGSGGRCTLLVGDLATLHDLNGLASLSKTSLPLVIVVLNNAGGGIFRFLPIATHQDFYSPYFDTPHVHDFRGCCEGFGLPYTCATTVASFEASFERARRESGPHIIEVPTVMDAGYAMVETLKLAGRDAAQQLASRLLDSQREVLPTAA